MHCIFSVTEHLICLIQALLLCCVIYSLCECAMARLALPRHVHHSMRTLMLFWTTLIWSKQTQWHIITVMTQMLTCCVWTRIRLMSSARAVFQSPVPALKRHYKRSLLLFLCLRQLMPHWSFLRLNLVCVCAVDYSQLTDSAGNKSIINALVHF